MRAQRQRQLAQTATEYMMVIAVIVVAAALLTYGPMNSALSEGGQAFKDKYQEAGRQGYMGSASDGKR